MCVGRCTWMYPLPWEPEFQVAVSCPLWCWERNSWQSNVSVFWAISSPWSVEPLSLQGYHLGHLTEKRRGIFCWMCGLCGRLTLISKSDFKFLWNLAFGVCENNRRDLWSTLFSGLYWVTSGNLDDFPNGRNCLRHFSSWHCWWWSSGSCTAGYLCYPWAIFPRPWLVRQCLAT